MSIYGDQIRACWIVSCRFKDLNSVAKRTTKRGFKTQEEAEKWEQGSKSNRASGCRPCWGSSMFTSVTVSVNY